MSSERRLVPQAAPPAGYGVLLAEIKQQIRKRQYQALRAANHELLDLYWWLGENISRRQAALGWGKAVLEMLASDLQAEFPGRNGLSAQNLWLTRQLFTEYSPKPDLQLLVREVSWAKNLVKSGGTPSVLTESVEVREYQNVPGYRRSVKPAAISEYRHLLMRGRNVEAESMEDDDKGRGTGCQQPEEARGAGA